MYIRNNIHVTLYHEAVINFYVLKPMQLLFLKKEEHQLRIIVIIFFDNIGTTKISYLSLNIRDFEIIKTFFV